MKVEVIAKSWQDLRQKKPQTCKSQPRQTSQKSHFMKHPSHLLPTKLHFPENSSPKSHKMGREELCGSHMSQTLTFNAGLLNLTSFTKPKSTWMPQEQRGSRRIYSEVTTCCLKLSGTPVESTSHPPGLSCISKTDNSQKCLHWLGGGGVNDWLLVQCPRVVLVCRYKVHIVTLLHYVPEIKQGWVGTDSVTVR